MSTTLQAHLRNATKEGHAPATIVELAGSIDPATLETLEAAMDRCVAEKRHRVIFDLHGLNYINSTGMGMLVQFSDACHDAGGALALVRVQPKVLLVIEMLGLQELFQIVDDVTAAFSAIDGAAPPAAAPAEAPAAPAAPSARPPSTEAPVGTACPACQAVLTLGSGAGRYRCPRCLSTLDATGETVRATPEDADRVAELWLPPHGDFLDPASALVFSAGHRAGLSDADARKIADTAAACWKKLAAMLLRYGGKGDRRLRVLIRATDGRLWVRTACGGDALEASSFDAERSGVDRLDYLVSAQGNLLTLEKGK